MDEFDQASELEQKYRDVALANIRARKKSSFTGYCRYCNDSVIEGSFCSTDCQKDQALEDRIKSIRGN